MKTIETLTPGEIAKILKLHPFTVTRLAREGKLPAFKVGGVWRFRRDEFEHWINQHSNRKKMKAHPNRKQEHDLTYA